MYDSDLRDNVVSTWQGASCTSFGAGTGAGCLLAFDGDNTTAFTFNADDELSIRVNLRKQFDVGYFRFLRTPDARGVNIGLEIFVDNTIWRYVSLLKTITFFLLCHI